jgi:drug/metabolite transporter (DMT)-like permease
MTALFLLVAVAVSGTSLTGLPAGSYLAIIAVAVVSQLIGHNAMNWALGFLPAAMVAIAILGEPVGATVIAVFVLDEVPTLLELVGAAVVLVGMYLALRHAEPVIAPEPFAPETATLRGPTRPNAE